MEEERNSLKIAYLNEISEDEWDWLSLTEEDRAEWDVIVSDYRNGEDKKIHRARVADFKDRMNKKHAKK